MSQFIRYNKMSHCLSRSGEVAQDPDVSKCVKRVHDDVLAPKAAAFCAAHEAVGAAQSAVARARRKARQSLAVFDSPYCTIRSVVLAYDPDVTLPDTLKAQTTDTAKLEAVSGLLSVVQSHAGEPWAEELLADEFGTLAPEVKAALEEVIAATKALWVAQRARANAFAPAYESFLAFKRVVRDDMGASSVHYRRLRVHKAASSVEEAEEAAQAEQADEAAPDSGVVPSAPGGSTGIAGEPKPVKVA